MQRPATYLLKTSPEQMLRWRTRAKLSGAPSFMAWWRELAERECAGPLVDLTPESERVLVEAGVVRVTSRGEVDPLGVREPQAAVCPSHGEVDAVWWNGALVCPDDGCHRTCAPRRSLYDALSVPVDDELFETVDGVRRRKVVEFTEVIVCSRCGEHAAVAAGCASWDGPVCDSCSRILEATEEVSVELGPPAELHSVPDFAALRAEARALAQREGRCTADVSQGVRCRLCGKTH